MFEYHTLSLKTVDSTSRYLKDYLCHKATANSHPQIVVCRSEQQTAGYGQQGSAWQTNKDSAIFSIALPLAEKPEKQWIAPPTSIRVALTLQNCLKTLVSEPVFVKWPNDLYDAKGKVAGILIEQVRSQSQRYLVIGVGINRGDAAALHVPQGDYVLSALSKFSLSALLEKWLPILHNLDTQTALTDKELCAWQAVDWFANKEVLKVKLKKDKDAVLQTATYLSIDHQGQALLEINHQLKTLSSGIYSLRKCNKEV